jgi:hypothetical protein
MSEEQQQGQAVDDFAQQAQGDRPGMLREFGDFLLHNKKWWLLPIVVVLALLVVLISIGSSGGGVFVYTLF